MQSSSKWLLNLQITLRVYYLLFLTSFLLGISNHLFLFAKWVKNFQCLREKINQVFLWSRFSLRRLFYGNPLLPPPPWGNSPWTSALSSSSSSRSRRGKSNPGPSHQAYDRNGGGGLEEGASRTNATTPSSTRSRHFFPPDSTSERSVTNPSSSSSAGIYGRDWRGGESTSHAHHHPGSSCASSLTGATMAAAGPSSAYYPGGTFVGADGRAVWVKS